VKVGETIRKQCEMVSPRQPARPFHGVKRGETWGRVMLQGSVFDLRAGTARPGDRGAIPLPHDRHMPANREHQPDPEPFVVEQWWCPVCERPAHRTLRPGRPKIYCGNACRQRAYRWRKRNDARTIARPGHRAAGSFVPGGRNHALRNPRDFVGHRRDRRGRQPTVCGALAKPWQLAGQRTHYDFIDHTGTGCRTCTTLIAPLLDGQAPATEGLEGQPDPTGSLLYEMCVRQGKSTYWYRMFAPELYR
jgi:hypothetical protein